MSRRPPRDVRQYGLGPSDRYVLGPPRITGQTMGPCPNCHCPILFEIQVDVEHPMLRGSRGIGSYIGCAACPFASPMAMVATDVREAVPKDPPFPWKGDGDKS